MGGTMSYIVPGIYVGGLSAARSLEQLDKNNITHLCSAVQQTVESSTRKQIIFRVGDSPEEDLSRYFEEACIFIHEARVSDGSVLIHCACGVSRSVTLTLAYLLVITDFSLADLFKAVQGARNCSCPNYGFMQQLLDFERTNRASLLRDKLVNRFGDWPVAKKEADRQALEKAIAHQEYYIIHGVYPGDVALHDPLGPSPEASRSSVSSKVTKSDAEKIRSLNSTFYTVYAHGKPRDLGEFLSDRKPPQTTTTATAEDVPDSRTKQTEL